MAKRKRRAVAKPEAPAASPLEPAASLVQQYDLHHEDETRLLFQNEFSSCLALSEALVNYMQCQDLSLVEAWKDAWDNSRGTSLRSPSVPSPGGICKLPKFAQGGAYIEWYSIWRDHLEGLRNTGVGRFCEGAHPLPDIDGLCAAARERARSVATILLTQDK